MAHIKVDSASGGTGARNRFCSRMKRPSHSTAPNTSALPIHEPAPDAASPCVINQTPAAAVAMASSVALPGRSPSTAMATAADTSGRVPRMTPPSTAEVRRRPAISRVV